MDKITLSYPYNTDPANSIEQILSKPFDKSEVIRLAIFNQHRFAFYFWAKWNKKHEIKNKPPALVSFDWHQDLCCIAEQDEEQLRGLDLGDLAQVSFYAWAKLNPLNDNHIVSAAYSNQLSDIYVVCKQRESFENFEEVEEVIDYKGGSHFIKKFRTPLELLAALKMDGVENLYFDIDLDYFTIENSSTNSEQHFTYVDDEEVNRMFDPQSELMQFLFKRIMGFTIALEPEHTGGLKKSLKYFNLLEKLYFKSFIGGWDCGWNENVTTLKA